MDNIIDFSKARTAIIGTPKVEIDGFLFNKLDLENPLFLSLLLAVVEPTKKQKEILDKVEIIIKDAENKIFYPRAIKKEEKNGNEQ